MRVNLKKIIDESEFTRVELAEKVGVSRQTIHAIETKKYSPSIQLALKLSKVLEVDINKMFILEKGDL